MRTQNKQYEQRRTILTDQDTDMYTQAGAGQKETGQGTSVFDANKGSIGSAFAKDGSIGQIGEKVGGPFSSEGMIGRSNLVVQ